MAERAGVPQMRVPGAVDRAGGPPSRRGRWALGALPAAPSTVIGVALVLLLVGAALAADLVRPGDPLRPVGPPLQAPSASFPLGTDDLGRDVLAEVIHGGRGSLAVGAVVALAAALLGSAVGAVAGYTGGTVDDAVMRVTELFQVVPRFFLAIVVAALFGASLPLITALLALTFWPATARLVRAQVLGLRGREFVVAARALGARERTILLRHILPNAVASVVVSAALQIGAAILVEASLGFLGLGDRRVPSWGYMLATAQPFLRTAPWLAVAPGGALVLTVLGVNLVADGLNDALNPRLARRRRPETAW